MDEEHDLPKIGIPRKLSAILPAIRDSIRQKPASGSGITGSPSPDNVAARSIGTRHGGTGVATIPDVAARLARAFDLPETAAMLARSLAPLLAWGDASLYGSHGFEGVKVTDVKVRDGVSHHQADAMLKALAPYLMPCEASFAAQKLTELRVLTAHRARDGSDTELLAAAYTRRLAEYPRDVVNMACDRWADANQFWPTWADLKNELDNRMKGRKQIRDALRAAL
jgi:hypothetical protein